MPTVVPPTAPNGPPTINPVTPGISKLSNHDPEATSMAKSSASPIIDTVILAKHLLKLQSKYLLLLYFLMAYHSSLL